MIGQRFEFAFPVGATGLIDIRYHELVAKGVVPIKAPEDARAIKMETRQVIMKKK